MARFALLTAAVVIVGLLGVVIDAQSRIRVDRPDEAVGPHLIFASGRVEGATREADLRFQLTGLVEDLLVEEAQFVEKGDLLGRLDDAVYRHEVDLAAAELDLAEAQLERLINGSRPEERAEARALYRARQAELERAQLTWERIRELRDARAVSQQEADDKRTLVSALTSELEAAKARLELLEAPARKDEILMAEARIRAANARLELAKVQLDWTKLHAPTKGQILKVAVEPGELTGPDSPEPAVVLVDTSEFHVRAFVEELDAPRVQVGMRATVTTDGIPGKQFEGRVTRVSPCMTTKTLWSDDPAERYDTKTREVWIKLADAGALVVGLRADVVIVPQTDGLPAQRPSAAALPSVPTGG